jgi:hypothetical protein
MDRKVRMDHLRYVSEHQLMAKERAAASEEASIQARHQQNTDHVLY